MKQLLFVDDELKLLDGLKRSLRSMRHEWAMTFVGGGEDALKALEGAPFDVVVSDMRMPGMDGAQLLNEVRRRYPHIVRVVLSGHSDQEMIYQSISASHQYLAKPCEVERLKAAISRACALRDVLGSESLKRLVAGLQRIPSRPGPYLEIEQEAESRRGSLKRIGEIIAKDMGMTAKILQLVNSAYFGLHGTVSTAEQAVNLLGLDTVRALVLTVHLSSQFQATGSSLFSMDRLWADSIATGAIARAIAKAEQAPALTVDQAFTAGLLHDVGILVLAANVLDRYNAVIRAARDRHIEVWEAERQEFNATHAEVGASLLGLWGLSDPIVEAVTFHHRPADCVGETFSPLTAVHVANVLQQEGVRQATGEALSQLDLTYLDKLKLTDRLPHWRELAVMLQGEKTNE